MDKRLPLKDTFTEAIYFTCQHYRLLPKVGFPIIIFGLISLIAHSFFPDIYQHFSAIFEHSESSVSDGEFSFPWGRLFLNFAYYSVFWIAVAMSVIRCHRLFVLGEQAISDSSVISWTGNEFTFIGWWIRIMVSSLLIFIPFFILIYNNTSIYQETPDNEALEFVANGLFELPFLYLISRWSLVLPASAVDQHGKSLTWSWNLSRGNGWRLTLLVGLLPYTTDKLFDLYPLDDSFLINLLRGLIWLVIGVVQVCLLSLCYRYFVDQETERKSALESEE